MMLWSKFKWNKSLSLMVTGICLMVFLSGCQSSDDGIAVSDDEALEQIVDEQKASEKEMAFPAKSIQLVVPFAPGGGTDSVARALAQTGSKYFDQPIIPVNKLGDSGARGIREGIYSKNDGYTVTVITSEVNSLAAYGLIDFDYTTMEPLILLNSEPGLVVVSRDFPYDSIEALIENDKTAGVIHTIGSAGEGSIWNLAAVGVEKETGLKFEYRYYDGTSLAVLDVLGGKLDMVIAGVSEVIEHIEAGEVKVLTVLSEERPEVLKDTPTFSESGYDFSIATWRGLAIPLGVSEEVRQTLIDGFTKASQDEEFISLLGQMNLNYDYRETDAFLEFLREDYDRYVDLVE